MQTTTQALAAPPLPLPLPADSAAGSPRVGPDSPSGPSGVPGTDPSDLLPDVPEEIQATNQLAGLAGGLPAPAPLSFPSTNASMSSSLEQMSSTDAAGAKLIGATLDPGNDDA